MKETHMKLQDQLNSSQKNSKKNPSHIDLTLKLKIEQLNYLCEQHKEVKVIYSLNDLDFQSKGQILACGSKFLCMNNGEWIEIIHIKSIQEI